MRSVFFLLAFCSFVLQAAEGASGLDVRLINGNTFRGQPVSYSEDGVILRLEIGGFSERISWSQMTQETLRELANDPKATRYAEPFIELTPEEVQRDRQKKEIVLREVPRLEPLEKTGFFAAFNSPAGWVILAVLYLGNLYAAFEVARFRNRPPALVLPVSALLPVAGPAIFLAMPSGGSSGAGADGGAAADYAPAPALAEAKSGRKTTVHVGVPSGGGLSLAQAARPQAAASSEPSVYKRGDFTFNRRFFESKFPGFFRVVPSEAEKDLVLVIRGFKNEYVAKRISRISSNEMHINLLRGGSEAQVQFAEINEVQVRHKDAKA